MMTIIHVIIVVQKIIVMVGKQDIVVHCANGMVVGIVTIATQWIFKLIVRRIKRYEKRNRSKKIFWAY